MKLQDFFSLCQIQQPAWLQLDHRKLGPSEMRLMSDPCIIKLKKKKKHAFMCDMTQCQDEVRTYSAGTHILKVVKWG